MYGYSLPTGDILPEKLADILQDTVDESSDQEEEEDPSETDDLCFIIDSSDNDS